MGPFGSFRHRPKQLRALRPHSNATESSVNSRLRALGLTTYQRGKFGNVLIRLCFGRFSGENLGFCGRMNPPQRQLK